MIEAAIIAIVSFLVGSGAIFFAMSFQAKAHEKLTNTLLTQIRYLQRMNVAKDLAVYGGMEEIEEKAKPSQSPEELMAGARGAPDVSYSGGNGFFPGSGQEHMGV